MGPNYLSKYDFMARSHLLFIYVFGIYTLIYGVIICYIYTLIYGVIIWYTRFHSSSLNHAFLCVSYAFL